MKATFKTTLVLSASLVLAAAGCSEGEPSPDADTGILPTDIGSKVGEKIGEATEALAKTYADQLGKLESQAESLKASAKTLGDDKLNDLVGDIDDKLGAARGKVDELETAGADTAQGIGSELKTLMGDLQDLYKQAMERVAQLKGSELPGGVKLPGG